MRAPIIAPGVVAGDYTADQAAAFREQFKPLAAHYRSRLRRVGWGMGAAVAVFLILGHLLPDNLTVFCFLGGVASFLLVGVIGWPVLPPCPACHNSLDGYVGTFCPECGSPSLKRGWLQPPKCNSCGKWMGTGRGGRSYKIRACTHCGVMLDEMGL